MRILLMVVGLSLVPLVAAAQPASLPNENLPGNSATLPNSNLPGSMPDDNPISLPNTDTTPSVYLPGAWMGVYLPGSNVPERNPTLPPPPDQVDPTAELQRQLAAARADAESSKQDVASAREDAAQARDEAAEARDEAAQARDEAAALRSQLPPMEQQAGEARSRTTR